VKGVSKLICLICIHSFFLIFFFTLSYLHFQVYYLFSFPTKMSKKNSYFSTNRLFSKSAFSRNFGIRQIDRIPRYYVSLRGCRDKGCQVHRGGEQVRVLLTLVRETRATKLHCICATVAYSNKLNIIIHPEIFVEPSSNLRYCMSCSTISGLY